MLATGALLADAPPNSTAARPLQTACLPDPGAAVASSCPILVLPVPASCCCLLLLQMTLVFHEVLHRGGTSTAWHFAGSLLGLRHYHGGPSSGDGGSRSRGGGRGGAW